MSPDPTHPGALSPGRPREELVAEVARVLAVLPDGATTVVACSGGSDSTALAFLVADARPDLVLTLAYVAHGLRDPADDATEAALVAQHARWIGAQSVRLTVTVERTGEGPEADARAARYAALEAEVARQGAAALLLGHHADDQAETLLLRLARGTGPDGLGGMAPIRGVRIRPLLRVRREDLVRHCALEGLPSIADPMNEDLDVRRVRIRAELLPALMRIGPDPVGALTRLAALARDESAALELVARRTARELGVRSIGAVRLVPSAALRALPPGLARRLVRRVLSEVARQVAGPRVRSDAPRAVDVERVRSAPDGWRATLPGPLDVTVTGGWHVVAPMTSEPTSPVRLAVRAGDGLSAAASRRAHWPRTGWSIEVAPVAVARDATQLPLIEVERLAPGQRTDRLAAELAEEGPFLVRARRDGDRVRTAGGTRSVADVMAEAGVPRALRDLLPLVARAADDRILWVPGLVIDVDARTGDVGEARVRLQLDVLSGSADGRRGVGPLP